MPHARSAVELIRRAGAVLFDLDGTLVITHIDFGRMRQEVRRLASEAGVNPPVPIETDVLGMVDRAVQTLSRSVSQEEGERFRVRALDRLREIETEQCARPEKMPGAAELCRALRSMGLRVGIVTRNCRDVSERLIRTCSLECDVLLTRDDVERVKPDPEHLLEALRRMAPCGASFEGTVPDGIAVMVGDHWLDVVAGKRAGCATIGLLHGREPAFFEPAVPDALVQDVAELLANLNSHGTGCTRRDLLDCAAVAVALPWASLASGSRGDPRTPGAAPSRSGGRRLNLDDVWSYCSHEHWGSIASFGMEPGGFRADVVPDARPLRRTGLMDILLDPYFNGCMAATGTNIHQVAAAAGFPDPVDVHGRELARLWETLQNALASYRAVGTFQCLRRGLRTLHGVDIAERRPSVTRLDESVAAAYADPFAWYEKAMARYSLRRVLRPVQPEYLWDPVFQQRRPREYSFMRPVLRIDPFLEFWKPECPRRDALARHAGVEPADAASWRAFIGAVMEMARLTDCVGIKQLQAYTRSLEFVPRTDAEVRFRGELTASEVRVFQDWVVHEFCKQAADRGWPHQIHVGTHNLPDSAPEPLARLATTYRKMPLVLLHCWPYHREAACLAAQQPNVYLDPCWLAVLHPGLLEEALSTWLGFVPTHKILCGHDATSVEMAGGAVENLRAVLGRLLEERVQGGALTREEAHEVADSLLHGNAERLYRWAV